MVYFNVECITIQKCQRQVCYVNQIAIQKAIILKIERVYTMQKIQKIVGKMVALMSALLLILAGCGGATTGNATTLRIATVTPSNSLNNLHTTESANSNIILNYMEGLLIQDMDGQMQPGAAESYTTSEDGLVYTFKLRDNSWSNGKIVTAHDFVFAWQTEATDKKAGYKQYQEYLKNGKDVVKGNKPVEELGVKALDDKTLEITLETPKTYFLGLLAHMSLMPINEEFFNEVGAEAYGTSADTVLANGAYKLTEYDGATGYTLEKRNEYWDAKNVDVPTVKVQVIKEITTQTVMWDNGELDEVYLSGDTIDKYIDSPNLNLELDRSVYYMYMSPFTGTPAPAYASKNLRSAVAHAIDKKLLAESVLKDGSIGADFILPYSIITEKGKEFRDVANQYNEPMFDVAKAQELFAAAQAELGTQEIEIPITIDDAERNKKTFENIKAQLEQNLPGIKVNLTNIPSQTYFPTLYEYNTPGARHGWISSLNDPSQFLALFTAGSTYNFGKTNLEEYTRLVALSESAEDMLNPEQRWKHIAEAEKALVEEYYNIPLTQKGNRKLVTEGITGLSYNNDGPQNVVYRWVKVK